MAYLRSPEFEFEAECMTLVELSERHPADSGVLAATLLNRLSLRHGEALYLPAGNLHAYLRGVAVEVMANSDNVLRGGLTSKHVDVDELLGILDFTPIAPADLRPTVRGEGPRRIYTPPVDEFIVTVWRFDEGHLGHELTAVDMENGPHIVLCTEGSAFVHQGSTSLQLNRGDAVWISDKDRSIRLRAEVPTTLFAAGVPRR